MSTATAKTPINAPKAPEAPKEAPKPKRDPLPTANQNVFSEEAPCLAEAKKRIDAGSNGPNKGYKVVVKTAVKPGTYFVLGHDDRSAIGFIALAQGAAEVDRVGVVRATRTPITMEEFIAKSSMDEKKKAALLKVLQS